MALVNPQTQHIQTRPQVVAFNSEHGAEVWRLSLREL